MKAETETRKHEKAETETAPETMTQRETQTGRGHAVTMKETAET